MIGQNHIEGILRAHEIDVAHIDSSLTYRENCQNLKRQFGLQFARPNYARMYQAGDANAKAHNEANQALINRMISNHQAAPKAALEEPPALPNRPIFPFDPIERAREVEGVVMRNGARRYYRFRHANFYGPGGIVTGDMVGCCLLCAYCWNYDRNETPMTGEFCSPLHVVSELQDIATSKRCKQFRLSGAEPFLGLESAKHIADVIRSLNKHFIIETNGLILGAKPELLDLFAGMDIFWRVTIKGHNDTIFEQVTGAKGEFYKLPLQAIAALQAKGWELQVAFNPNIVNERMLNDMPADIEYENMRSYKGVAARMKERGLIACPSIRPLKKTRTCWKPAYKEGDEWGQI